MRSVLAVGAHPDDIELGCGGALAAHRAAGHTLTMLVLSDGGNGPGTADRWAEQDAAARVLDAGLVWGGLADCGLVPDAATVTLVEKVINAVGADVVYVHAPEDSHQDHRAAVAATLAAARHGTCVLHYRSPSTLDFRPTLYIDIAEHLDRKLAALACHRSQVEGSVMVDPEAVAASARHFGAEARVRYAEAFAPARFVWDLVPVRDWPGTPVPRSAPVPARTPADRLPIR
ncbi:MAG: PIG-L family deacetylase [Actinobacteria bacterium]|nr:MAG: PIG-L family deacetylase [Actinomycetota bacterium]